MGPEKIFGGKIFKIFLSQTPIQKDHGDGRRPGKNFGGKILWKSKFDRKGYDQKSK